MPPPSPEDLKALQDQASRLLMDSCCFVSCWYPARGAGPPPPNELKALQGGDVLHGCCPRCPAPSRVRAPGVSARCPQVAAQGAAVKEAKAAAAANKEDKAAAAASKEAVAQLLKLKEQLGKLEEA